MSMWKAVESVWCVSNVYMDKVKKINVLLTCIHYFVLISLQKTCCLTGDIHTS